MKQQPKRRGRPPKNKLTPVNKTPSLQETLDQVVDDIEQENKLEEMHRLATYWRDAYHQIDARYRDSEAVIKYLENKIAQLVRR
jgi:hypothetical protein